MNNIETFQEFLVTQSTQIPTITFIFNFGLTVIMTLVLGYVYQKYGRSFSNRKKFAKNFLLLGMTTMFIITIVKSSLALSLGLVGALSIVRFRSAIKEPEELGYLFFVIAIGLGMGANQTSISLTAFIIVVLIIILTSFKTANEELESMFLTIKSNNNKKVNIDSLVDIIKIYSPDLVLKRVDETKHELEALFIVKFNKYKDYNNSRKELLKLDNSIEISFLDNNNFV